MATFVQMYHPQVPRTALAPVRVALSSVDDHAARGWLLVDPDVVPPAPSTPWYPRAEADSKFLTEPAARAAFAHLNELGQLVIVVDGVETIVGGGEGGSGGLTTEQVQDLVASMVLAGTNVTKVYDDAAGTLTLSAAGGSGGATDPEVVRDTIAAALVAGANVTITPSDAGDTITISVPDATTTARGTVEMATSAEAVAGTDTARAVTPAGVKAAIDAAPYEPLILDEGQAVPPGTTPQLIFIRPVA